MVPYRRHHLFVEGECDVCTVILVVGVRSALGLHGLETGRPTLTHTRAGADKTLVIQDRDAALPTGALTVPFVEQARSRATPDLEGWGGREREREREGAGGSGQTPNGNSRMQVICGIPHTVPSSRRSFHSGTGMYCSHRPTWPRLGSHSPW